MTAIEQHDVPLESGTNELEILVFTFLDRRYGVSVDNEKKCQAVGANAQFTKPRLDQPVD